jgi:surfeit locus 1 family protein
MTYHPAFWPTITTIPILIVLLGLGTWQLERLQWKEGLIADRAARATAAPIDLPEAGSRLSPDRLADLDFRRAIATGRFLHDREMYLAARTMLGAVGHQVITPLQRADGSFVLLDRGWVPDDRRDPARRPDGQVEGVVTVEGTIRAPAARHWLQPDNEPARNLWFWNDLDAMAGHAGVPSERLVPVYLEAGPAPNPGGLPVGGQTKVNLPNDHLQYAITWYGLAIALAVIYVVYHLRRG